MRRALVVAALVAACGNGAPASQPTTTAPPVVTAPPRPTKGRIVTESFRSEALGVHKDVMIYLPEGYEGGTKRYPVFYYLHGLGGDESNWVEGGKLEAAANALGLEAIVVMPDGDNHFYVNSAKPNDYEACLDRGEGMFIPLQSRKKTCVRTLHYETYIVDDLVGWVDRTYRTIAAREGRALAGLSMGGYGALMLAMRHPNRFAAAASHSGVDALLYGGPYPYERGKVTLITDPSAWGSAVGNMGTWIRGLYGADLAGWRAYDPASLVDALKPGTLKLYLDCGTEDEFLLHNGMQYLHDLLLAKGIDHAYYLGPGHHDFRFWAARLPESLAFLRTALAPAR